MPDVVVIGAGPAGLTTAYELQKLGLSSAVLEADHQVGGISRTVDYHGFRFDIGGHRFFSKVPLINELWDEILGEDFLLRPRLSRIYYKNRFFDYPLKAGNALAGLGLFEAARCGLSYARARLRPSADAKSFEDWVAGRFGYRLYNIFFKTYTEKVWGIPCRDISADWAAQRIKNLSLWEAVRHALFSSGKSKDGQVITTLIDEFKYPRLGPGQMWEACTRRLAEQGNPTHCDVAVTRVRHARGQVECVYGQTAAGEPTEFAGQHYVSSMPLRELIRALDPPAPAQVLEAASRLRYRDYLTVVLIVKRAEVFPDNWVYVHSPEVRMGRIQNYKNWSPAMVPDPSRTSLGLEYFVWETDEMWRWDDRRLIELGTHECAQLGLVDPRDVEDGTVVRMKKAYPIYDHGYQEAVATLRSYLETLSNLQTVGRNGLHRYNNQDHSMLTGVYAAENITGARHDVWSVNTEQEYHEEQRQTDASAGGDRQVPGRRA
jgi:protoporphyrinogen oxidase